MERLFFLPPFAAPALFIAILLTQILAVLMCGLGWLVPSIPRTLIGWVWAYNIAWMFVEQQRMSTCHQLEEH
jgi:H+-transporting ATPase